MCNRSMLSNTHYLPSGYLSHDHNTMRPHSPTWRWQLATLAHARWWLHGHTTHTAGGDLATHPTCCDDVTATQPPLNCDLPRITYNLHICTVLMCYFPYF